ncbi:MAG: pilus assembly protein [Desulfuromonas sp.]|nr:MAG: pilus assembly protein [Desulfuromonas sp.]
MMKNRLYLNDKAFTLIELLVVVSLLGILAAFATVQYYNQMKRISDTVALTDLRTMQTALIVYFSENAKYPD